MNVSIHPFPFPLPHRWPVVPFDAAFADGTGGNPKVKATEYLADGHLPIIDQGQSAVAGYTNDPALACRVKRPCILFGDHTRAFKYVDFDFALGADGVKVLLPSGMLEPRFAFHFLSNVVLPEDVGYSRHFKFLKRIYVPLPPLAEQRRIAAILDKADALRRKRQEAIALTEQLLRSTFLEMFGDPVTNPKRWPTRPVLETLMAVDHDGEHSPSSRRKKLRGNHRVDQVRQHQHTAPHPH
jgi:type I restriction enzyme S subunit